MIKKPKYYLTFITSLITLLISVISLINRNIYTERINRITEYELLGQDLATAIISMIFLYIILYKEYSNVKIKIIWLGFLLYQFYVYAYFSFGGVSSVFYLIYLTITGLSLFLFFTVIADILRNNQFPKPVISYPRKSISIFLIFSIALVGTIEIIEIFSKTIINIENLNPFFAFYVLDLSIIFPLIIIAAILNYKGSAIGYLLSGVALIKIVTILPGAVIFNDIFHRLFAGYFLDLPFDIIALIITLTGYFFTVLFMKRIN